MKPLKGYAMNSSHMDLSLSIPPRPAPEYIPPNDPHPERIPPEQEPPHGIPPECDPPGINPPMQDPEIPVPESKFLH